MANFSEGELMPVKILTFINHKIMRQALRSWLEFKFPQYPILEATSSEEALPLAQASWPAVIITSMGLSPRNELAFAIQIRTLLPKTWMVILTTCEDVACQAEITAIGTNFCIPMRDLPPTELQALLALLLSYPDEPGAEQQKIYFDQPGYQPNQLAYLTTVTI
jgi:DNA-binding NarL/FixJ family response regulator